MLLQVWPESLHDLYGCQEYLKDTVEHDLFWDATWCAGLEDPAMYSKQSHRKTWHAQFCCTTRGIDPYVPACTTQLHTCQGTRYPICGYQSSNGMLQDSEFNSVLAVGVQFVVIQWKLDIGLQLCLHDVAFCACHNCRVMYVYGFMSRFPGCNFRAGGINC